VRSKLVPRGFKSDIERAHLLRSRVLVPVAHTNLSLARSSDLIEVLVLLNLIASFCRVGINVSSTIAWTRDRHSITGAWFVLVPRGA